MLVRELAKIAFGLRGHGTMISLKACYDGSGKEDDHPVITVGGFFADDTVCDAIESDWDCATGGKEFHFRVFNSGKCKLGSATWTEEQRIAFLKRLGGIVNRQGVEVITTSLEVAEYQKFLSASSYADVFGPAYSMLAVICAMNTEMRLGELGMIMDKLAYVYEKGERAHELLKALIDFEKSTQRGSRSHHFPGKECVLLQASDLIAGSAQKVLMSAGKVLCLDNGKAFTPFDNFEHFYSKDGVTASVIPPVRSKFRAVINKPSFVKLDSITAKAELKYPKEVKRRKNPQPTKKRPSV